LLIQQTIATFCTFVLVATPIKKPAPARKSPVRKKAPVKRRAKKSVPVQVKLILAALLLILLSPFYYGYVVKMFTSTWRWVRDFGSTPHYRVYKSFNIPIPDKYSIHGIDVSSYQGKIDWQMVKSMEEDSVHITFAFIKATEGIVQVDPYFQRNWREGPKVGIICGAYHYFRPEMNGKWQARFFMQNVKPEKGDLPLVVDVEELDGVSPEKMRTELTAFLKYVASKSNTKPIIYSGLKFYQDNLQGHFDNYIYWLAHYYKPELDVTNTAKWRFWQHSDKARVNGINHVVDFDVFNGDSLAFKKLLIP
jgi:lysozyme